MSGNVTLKSEMPAVTASGLDNVVAAETALSHVDGEAGRLIVAGYDVEDLVKAYDFEGAAAALWRAAGCEPAPSEGEVREALGRAREAAFGDIPALLSSKRHQTVIKPSQKDSAPDCRCWRTSRARTRASGISPPISAHWERRR